MLACHCGNSQKLALLVFPETMPCDRETASSMDKAPERWAGCHRFPAHTFDMYVCMYACMYVFVY